MADRAPRSSFLGASIASLSATRRAAISTESRARLATFYARRAPDKLSGIDEVLDAWRGREHEMFRVLADKYGVPFEATELRAAPPSPSAARSGQFLDASGRLGASMQSLSATRRAAISADTVARLTAFYERYAPEKLAFIDEVLDAWEGREKELFVALAAKYGVPLTATQLPALSAALPSSAERALALSASAAKEARTCGVEARARLAAFYARHAPEKLAMMDEAVDAWSGREAEMFEAIAAKYGVAIEETMLQETPPPPPPPPPAALPRKAAAKAPGAKLPAKARAAVPAPCVPPSLSGTLPGFLVSPPTTDEATEPPVADIVVVGADAMSDATPEPPPPPPPPAVRARLVRFYAAWAPQKTDEDIDKALTVYARHPGGYDEMFAALVRKYGPEPTLDGSDTGDAPPAVSGATAAAAAAAASSESRATALAQRLLAIAAAAPSHSGGHRNPMLGTATDTLLRMLGVDVPPPVRSVSPTGSGTPSPPSQALWSVSFGGAHFMAARAPPAAVDVAGDSPSAFIGSNGSGGSASGSSSERQGLATPPPQSAVATLRVLRRLNEEYRTLAQRMRDRCDDEARRARSAHAAAMAAAREAHATAVADAAQTAQDAAATAAAVAAALRPLRVPSAAATPTAPTPSAAPTDAEMDALEQRVLNAGAATDTRRHDTQARRLMAFWKAKYSGLCYAFEARQEALVAERRRLAEATAAHAFAGHTAVTAAAQLRAKEDAERQRADRFKARYERECAARGAAPLPEPEFAPGAVLAAAQAPDTAAERDANNGNGSFGGGGRDTPRGYSHAGGGRGGDDVDSLPSGTPRPGGAGSGGASPAATASAPAAANALNGGLAASVVSGVPSLALGALSTGPPRAAATPEYFTRLAAQSPALRTLARTAAERVAEAASLRDRAEREDARAARLQNALDDAQARYARVLGRGSVFAAAAGVAPLLEEIVACRARLDEAEPRRLAAAVEAADRRVARCAAVRSARWALEAMRARTREAEEDHARMVREREVDMVRAGRRLARQLGLSVEDFADAPARDPAIALDVLRAQIAVADADRQLLRHRLAAAEDAQGVTPAAREASRGRLL